MLMTITVEAEKSLISRSIKKKNYVFNYYKSY